MEGRPVRLCYNCDEKFGHSHNHVCKRLFLLDGAVEDKEDIPEPFEAGAIEGAHFSFHAITGVRFSDTMQIHIELGDTSLVMLLDSGSMHNFISEAMAHRMGLPLQHRQGLTAMVTNGERVSCLGIIHQAAFTIDGDVFFADPFVLPYAGYVVVLGTQWLTTLGPILYDFNARTMTFKQRGREVCWHSLAC